MIARTQEQLHADAEALRQRIGNVAGLELAVEATVSTVGGGAMPTAELRSWAVTVRGKKPEQLDKLLRAATPPVIATIRDDKIWLDLRTIAQDELADVAQAVSSLVL